LRAPDGTLTKFDPPGAVITIPAGINAAGAITGVAIDASGIYHGFVRAPHGSFTLFQAQGAATGYGQGTWGSSINSAGEITGYYTDSNYVFHGFVRHRDGAFSTFVAPGAGTVPGNGTFSYSINPAGTVTGIYIDAQSPFTASCARRKLSDASKKELRLTDSDRGEASTKQALDALYTGLLTRKVSWVLDLDIRPGGHCPHVSRPAELAELLSAIV
jgi:hypothetical protein